VRAIKRIHDEVGPRLVNLTAPPDARALWIGRTFGSGQRILVVGCAYGHVSFYLKSLGNEVVGIDIAPTLVEVIRTRGIEAHECDIENEDAPSGLGTFDLVLCMETLEHLHDPVVVLRDKILHFVRPGGHLVVTVPNGAYLKDRLTLMLGRAPTFGSAVDLLPDRPYNLDHKTIFTRSGLVRSLTMAGFEIDRLFPTPGHIPGVVSRLSLVPVWRGLERGWPEMFGRGIMCTARRPQ
jgi:2-polyprenyl-3-methyl-5-hydroxy-6-metoxy-1,4-benzoquinol methylase